MTDRTTRDQIAHAILECMGGWPDLSDARDAADALISAGLVVPAGLRAHALDILDAVDSLEFLDLPEMRHARYGRIKLAAEALRDALELRETP